MSAGVREEKGERGQVRSDPRSSPRVLWALSRSDVGGVPLQLLSLLPVIAREGIEVHIAAPASGALAGRLRAASRGWIGCALDRLDPAHAARLARYCRAHGIDLIQTHGKGAGLAGRWAALSCGRPAVHAFRGFGMHRLPRWQRRAYLALERWLARRSAALVAVSPGEAEAIAATRIAPRERIEVIPNGIDAAAIRAGALGRAEARAALGLDPEAWIAGTLARADRVKGLERFVEIAARVGERDPRARFALFGIGPEDGGYGAQLRARAARSRAPIEWLAERAEGWRWLRAFDLYLSTSLSEGLPNAPLEAIALDLPVLLSDVRGNRDIAARGTPGMLYPPGDAAAAVARIGELRAGRGGPLAPAQRDALLAEYSLERQAAALAGLYRRILEREGERRPGD